MERYNFKEAEVKWQTVWEDRLGVVLQHTFALRGNSGPRCGITVFQHRSYGAS